MISNIDAPKTMKIHFCHNWKANLLTSFLYNYLTFILCSYQTSRGEGERVWIGRTVALQFVTVQYYNRFTLKKVNSTETVSQSDSMLLYTSPLYDNLILSFSASSFPAPGCFFPSSWVGWAYRIGFQCNPENS